MNSDIDNNMDAFYSRLMTWLKESRPAASIPSSGQVNDTVPLGETTAADFDFDVYPLDLSESLDLENLNIVPNHNGEAALDRMWVNPPESITHDDLTLGGEIRRYNLGEMSTVQTRFQTLLKRKLQAQIELNPPLFPWETELSDYETDIVDAIAESWVSGVRFWMPQLSNLAIPTAIPENVLSQLLEACSEAVSSQYQLGAKLVRAVQKLFPDEFYALNSWSGRILMTPTRSPEEQLQSLPYEEANNEQKMVLALLAAKEILTTLTIPVSPNQTPVERQWETSAGLVTLRAEYHTEDGVSQLRVSTRLPRGGSLTLGTPQASAKAERTYPGYLSVESYDLQPNQICSIEIRFDHGEQKPLTFAICPTN
ncbi:MAG: hypothetical protein F6J98_02610 [Moorea sp. SIO4G2]|nr:hypothetical protein [Moorena sp. SIO4G2]